jgi:hypothetical protein
MSDQPNSSTAAGLAPSGGIQVSDDPQPAAESSSTLETANEAQPDPAASDAGPAASPPASTQTVIAAHATDAQGATVIQALSSSIKSLNGTAVQAERSASQSPEAKIGALTALKAAEANHGHKFRDAVQHFGETVARAIKGELAIIHGLDEGKVADVKAVLTPPQNDVTS